MASAFSSVLFAQLARDVFLVTLLLLARCAVARSSETSRVDAPLEITSFSCGYRSVAATSAECREVTRMRFQCYLILLNPHLAGKH